MGPLRRAAMIAIAALTGTAVFGLNLSTDLSKKDRLYLEGVYKDTWACLAHFVSSDTGLPRDSHRPTRNTSLTNIGFYMAACAVAAKTNLMTDEEALRRLRACLQSLAKIEKWRGFPVTWVDVDTGDTTEKQFSTVDHLGNLTAGLVLVKSIYPELASSIDALLSPMNWGILYEPKNHFYRGGWRLDKKDFDVKQLWGDWYYSNLGADTRLGSFFGVALGQVLLDHWCALNRTVENKHG